MNKQVNEYHSLNLLHMQGILVPFVSAIRLSSKNHYKIEDANHLTICKPPNKDHPSYYLLLKCLKICMEVKTSNLSLLTSYMFM
jgi:hypothetical protein